MKQVGTLPLHQTGTDFHRRPGQAYHWARHAAGRDLHMRGAGGQNKCQRQGDRKIESIYACATSITLTGFQLRLIQSDYMTKASLKW
jgi:hypothetical protein